MKKTTFVWIMIILVAMNVIANIGSIFTLIPDLIKAVYVHNIFGVVFPIVNTFQLLISILYLYKLYNLKPRLHVWTNIFFGYTLFSLVVLFLVALFNASGNVLFVGIMTIPFLGFLLLFTAVWMFFYVHLSKHLIADTKPV